jgi:hypothetical protein
MRVHFDNTADPRAIEVAFMGFTDAGNMLPSDGGYKYSERADLSASFAFGTHADVNKDGSLEDLAIVAQWLGSGTGRADVVVTGGSLGTATVHMEECWDTSYQRSYYTDNANMSSTEGVASSCPAL